jgi:hypothetical protein
MQNTMGVRAALSAVLLILSASSAGAQIYESIGTRAQGMGGAFVAVADDATATWWNPAGLATGAFGSVIFERSRLVEPAERPDQGPAGLTQPTAFALAYPALGLSYYRLRVSEIRPSSPIAPLDPGRQDQEAAGVALRSLALNEFGATVGQSVGGRLVIASTLKVVRAGLSSASDDGPGDALDRLERAADLDISSDTHLDLDIGAMASFGRARAGVAVKHVREPEFGEGENAFELKRQARAGFAVFGAGGGAVDAVSAAVDADLTRTETALGDVRHVAAGAEMWLFRRRLALRGGVSANTVGDAGNSLSAGMSLGSGAAGVFVDGALTVGSDQSREGWSLGFRLAF